MEVKEQVAWTVYCTEARPGYASILAHPEKGELSERAPRVSGTSDAYRLAVGPEGGFTSEEVDLATQSGWQTLDLGPRVLRIETAAVVLAARFV
jgi:16S rRNA (uracil1498-N3)-methyltransferase